MNNKNNKPVIFGFITLAILLLLVTIVYARGYDKNDDWDDDNEMAYQDDNFDRGRGYGRKESGGKAVGLLGGLNFFDQDGNGEITRAEANERIDLIFSDIDSDADNQVSETEFTAFHTKKAEAMAEINYHNLTDEDRERINERTLRQFSRLDEDDDSYLSKLEFSDRLESVFEKMDRNEDDVIDMSELKRKRRW